VRFRTFLLAAIIGLGSFQLAEASLFHHKPKYGSYKAKKFKPGRYKTKKYKPGQQKMAKYKAPKKAKYKASKPSYSKPIYKAKS
jgi:hypothetical protein